MAVVVNRDGKTISILQGKVGDPGKAAVPSGSGTMPFTCSWVVPLEPGIYQVRVAARDANTGMAGSDHQWIDLPRVDASQPVKKIQLGSVFVRSRRDNDPAPDVTAPFFDQFTAARRFTPDSRLYFLAQMYNEASYPVDLAVKLYLGNRILMEDWTTVAKPPDSSETSRRIKGDFPLAQFAPGAYVLELSVTDRSTKATATRQVSFRIASR